MCIFILVLLIIQLINQSINQSLLQMNECMKDCGATLHKNKTPLKSAALFINIYLHLEFNPNACDIYK